MLLDTGPSVYPHLPSKAILCPGQLQYAELHHMGLHPEHGFMASEKALKGHSMMCVHGETIPSVAGEMGFCKTLH